MGIPPFIQYSFDSSTGVQIFVQGSEVGQQKFEKVTRGIFVYYLKAVGIGNRYAKGNRPGCVSTKSLSDNLLMWDNAAINIRG